MARGKCVGIQHVYTVHVVYQFIEPYSEKIELTSMKQWNKSSDRWYPAYACYKLTKNWYFLDYAYDQIRFKVLFYTLLILQIFTYNKVRNTYNLGTKEHLFCSNSLLLWSKLFVFRLLMILSLYIVLRKSRGICLVGHIVYMQKLKG